MVDMDNSDEEYPQELLDAHYIEDSVAHYPFEDVLIGLEALLGEKEYSKRPILRLFLQLIDG